MSRWPPGTEVIVGPFIVVAMVMFFGGRVIRALQASYPQQLGPLVEWWDRRSASARSSMTIGAVLFFVSLGCLIAAGGDLSRSGQVLALIVLTAGAIQFAYGLMLVR